ncbi:hypothetical protein [Frigoribacterium sp. UYMn621]|uniref:hypothetical protein n=1 Tax=Frigoribacterium sp. UYMn621 TaxID=3156343 RepID=UPI00339746E0
MTTVSQRKRRPRRLTRILRGSTGAIDLTSIMVGVLVIGIIGGVIGASVTTVIPWAQDSAAKSALLSVKTAESVYFVSHHSFGSLAELQAPTAFAADVGGGPGRPGASVAATVAGAPLLPKTESILISAGPGGWIASSESRTGTFFYLSSGSQSGPTTVLPVIAGLPAPGAVAPPASGPRVMQSNGLVTIFSAPTGVQGLKISVTVPSEITGPGKASLGSQRAFAASYGDTASDWVASEGRASGSETTFDFVLSKTAAAGNPVWGFTPILPGNAGAESGTYPVTTRITASVPLTGQTTTSVQTPMTFWAPTPGAISATGAATTIALIWSASPVATAGTRYEIYRGTKLVATVNGLTFTDSGLARGKTYTYKLRAILPGGTFSPWTEPVDARTV